MLRRLAQETGGLACFPVGPTTFTASIARSPTSDNSVLVAYAPANVARDGRWRRLAVRVNRPNCSARTRRVTRAGPLDATSPVICRDSAVFGNTLLLAAEWGIDGFLSLPIAAAKA